MPRKNNLILTWIVSIAMILTALVVASLGVRIPAVLVGGVLLFVVGIALLIISYIFQRRVPPVVSEEISSIPPEEQREITALSQEKGVPWAVRVLRENHPGVGLSDAVDAVRAWRKSNEVKQP